MKSNAKQNLPKSDENERLERLSELAFQGILPADKFLPRKDNPDKGVDNSIEVINENEEFTNFRAQIQLKGTFKQRINKDGSVSYPIETFNLKYLWNNLTSIYVLYIEPRNELRFVWLKDEIKKLNNEKPDWKKQTEVSIRFFQILNSEAINQIYETIQQEGLLHRKIKETLIANPEGTSKFEVNSLNLEVITSEQVVEILRNYGIELINSGHAKFVLEKINLLKEKDRKNPVFLLIQGFAEYNSGKYRTALDTINSINFNEFTLSESQQYVFDLIENGSSWQIGIITFDEYSENLKKLGESSLVQNSILDKFNYLRIDLLYETNLEKRREKLKTLQTTFNELTLDTEIPKETVFGVEFLLLEAEQNELRFEYKDILRSFEVARQTKVLLDEWFLLPQHLKKRDKWHKKAAILSRKMSNPVSKADLVYLSGRFWFHTRVDEWFFSAIGNNNYKLDRNEISIKIDEINSIIKIYEKNQKIYSVIRAKILLAEFFSFSSESEQAEELRKEAYRSAKKMSYGSLIRASECLFHVQLTRIIQKSRQEANIHEV